MRKIAFIDDCVEDPGNPDSIYLNAKMLRENIRYALIRHREDKKIIDELKKHHDVTTYNGLWYATDRFMRESEEPDFDCVITNCPPNWEKINFYRPIIRDYSRSLYCLRELNGFFDAKVIIFSGAPDEVFDEIKNLGISSFLRRRVTDVVEENIKKLLEMIK